MKTRLLALVFLCATAPAQAFVSLPDAGRRPLVVRGTRWSTESRWPTTAQSLFKWSSSSSSSSSSSGAPAEMPDVVETKGMPDLVSFLQPSAAVPDSLKMTESSSTSTDEGLSEYDGHKDSLSFGAVFSVAALVGGLIALAAGNYLGIGFDDVAHTASSFVHNPQQTIGDLIEDIREIGPAAPFFYGLLYCVAEILAIPATPLTLSAGYLFGLGQGVLVVLAAGTVAACVGFAIGKTALRGAVEDLLDENPEFRKLDKAIGKEGFKLLVLVRLTPIFPFSLSNYIYGASAIKFWPYFWGTLLGFTPGTFAYVYSGMVGQALMSGQGSEPWYYYAAGGAVLVGILKVITDTATGIVKAMEEDMDD